MIKQSRCGESHSELVFDGPTRPRPLTRLELANKFELEHPFFKVVMRPSYIKRSLVKSCFDATFALSKASYICHFIKWDIPIVFCHNYSDLSREVFSLYLFSFCLGNRHQKPLNRQWSNKLMKPHSSHPCRFRFLFLSFNLWLLFM